jgi:hypothetical protein
MEKGKKSERRIELPFFSALSLPLSRHNPRDWTDLLRVVPSLEDLQKKTV